jgi:hypothetical protein
MSEWISVKDQMPPRNESVLVWDGEVVCESAWVYFVDPKNKEYIYDAIWDIPGVTHWLPMIKPPLGLTSQDDQSIHSKEQLTKFRRDRLQKLNKYNLDLMKKYPGSVF